jgi:hypothetical protein
VSDSIPRYDVTSRTGLRRLVRSWRLTLAVCVALGAVAFLVAPLVVGVHRVASGQTATHRLERLARDAQPPSALVYDSGVRDDKGTTGFAYGTSRDPAAELLAVEPPSRWQRWREGGETANTHYYRSDKLILTIRVTACGLQRCSGDEQLVYTEVQDVS